MTPEIWKTITNSGGNMVTTNNDIPTINKWNEKGISTDYYLSYVILPYSNSTSVFFLKK